MAINNLRSNLTVPARFSYRITRSPPDQEDSEDITAVVAGERTVDIMAQEQVVRTALIEILNGSLDAQTTTYF